MHNKKKERERENKFQLVLNKNMMMIDNNEPSLFY